MSQTKQPSAATSRGTVSRFLNPADDGAAFTLTGASAAWDIDTTLAPHLTLTQDTKIETPENLAKHAGEMLRVSLEQDSTGSRKVSWGLAFDWTADGEPQLAQGPGTRTVIQFYCTGTNLLGAVFYKTPEE